MPLDDNMAIVYFGNDWYGENRTSSHHIARRLGARFPLLYVDTPGFRAPKATGRDFRKLWRKLSRAASLPRAIGPRMWHMTLPQIPFRRAPGASWLNEMAGTALTRRAVRHLGFRRFISWFVVPHPGKLAGRLGEELVVYYCTDAFAAFPGVDSRSIQALDDHLTVRADQLFVTSLQLLEAKRPLNPSAEYSPHGVDAQHFGQAMAEDLPVAEEAAGLPHPVVGFFGVIGAWIDVGLIAWLAAARPCWTFLLVGMAAADVEPLASLPNVVLAGPRPYEELPRWAKAFDVAILPRRRNRLGTNANPLKLREYLATGKPVVSVSTPEVDKFAGLVSIADAPEAFLAAIERAIATDTPEARQARMQAVSAMSWDRRVDCVLETVSRRLDAKRGKSAPADRKSR